ALTIGGTCYGIAQSGTAPGFDFAIHCIDRNVIYTLHRTAAGSHSDRRAAAEEHSAANRSGHETIAEHSIGGGSEAGKAAEATARAGCATATGSAARSGGWCG